MTRWQRSLNVDNTQEFRCISLCTGYAGIELGLRRVVPTLRTVAYVEIEAFAAANLVAKMEAGKLDAAPVWTDIKTFNGQAFSKRVHIVTAGYPCQGESHAGKRQGKADPRWLWPYIERIIEAVKPVWFFGENVSGHLTLGFPTVYRSLRLMGYAVEAGLFTAAECGAPHKRERLFILAHNSSSGCQAMQIQQAGQSTFRHGCGLVDAGGTKPRGLSGCQRQENTQISSAGKMADSECPEQGQGTVKETSARSGRDRFAKPAWPSRPGQPQYEWEKPRVVDNTLCRRHEPKKGQIQTGRDGVKYTSKDVSHTECSKRRSAAKSKGAGTGEAQPRTKRTIAGQIKSRLGRAVDGTNCRVDRLRLCGNGVSPQQAEKAARYLIKKFE